MGSFIARQPNGRLCRFSSVVDCITDYNMTEEDYIELCAERARDDARYVIEHHIQPYSLVENKFITRNMSIEEFYEIQKAMESPVTDQTKWVKT